MTGLDQFLAREIEAGNFPSGAALVGDLRHVLASVAAGAPADTLFDLASLTKVLCTAPLARLALRPADWSRRPGEFLPEFARTKFEEITLRHLATHTSGLPAWAPLYIGGAGPDAYRRELSELEPQERPGAKVIYSDLGILLLGEVLELVLGDSFDRLFASEIAGPAGAGARFGPIIPSEICAPTERGNLYERGLCEERGMTFTHFRTAMIRGEVHDGNAYYRGGVAAHAGLFGTVEDVWRLARPWLEGGGEYIDDWTPGLTESRGLFWQRQRGAESAIAEFSERAFGHTGFTGTSVWLDRERERIYVFLTNRVHPEVRLVDFNECRRRFHQVAIQL